MNDLKSFCKNIAKVIKDSNMTIEIMAIYLEEKLEELLNSGVLIEETSEVSGF